MFAAFYFFGASAGSSTLLAADYIITIGGGSSPTSNQISLEKNVQFFQRTLSQVGASPALHEIYFADGNSDKRDLQYQLPEPPESDAIQWMSTLLGASDSLGLLYRDHEVSPTAGPARKAYIDEALKKLAESTQKGDRVFIYVTAHGGSSSDFGFSDEFDSPFDSGEKPEYDTTVSLWNAESVSMREFSSWLDRFSTDVQIVLVMVQCYSGGFAHSIYVNGNERLGLHPGSRIGFFSQRHDRPSAGCTPEVLEENYQDYSTFFFAALGGVDRLGNPIASADYNADGSVSFVEAHTYAILTSQTLDIPLRTSEEILRRYGKFGGAAIEPEQAEDTPRPSLGAAVASIFLGGNEVEEVDAAKAESELVRDEKGLLNRQTTIEAILPLASRERQTVINFFLTQLPVKPEWKIQQVRSRFRRAGENVQKQQESLAVLSGEYSLLQNQLAAAARLEWPELSEFGYSPMISNLTNERADEFLEFIDKQPQAASLNELAERLEEASEKYEQAEVREAQWGRLLHALESTLLEQNLEKSAPSDVIDHYRHLVELEQGSL